MAQLEQLLKYGLELAKSTGADYAELRAIENTEKVAQTESGVSSSRTANTRGLSARVLIAGRWGFASCPVGGKATVKKLVASALGAAEFSPMPALPVRLSGFIPVRDKWESPCKIDPFTISESELVGMLGQADAAMAIAGIDGRVAQLIFRREHSLYFNSEGAGLTQTLTLSGGGVWAWALADNEILQRSWPCPGGSFSGQGYEYIQELDLPGNAGRIAREVIDLKKAPLCPDGITDLVISGSMLAAQLNYTCGYRAQLGTPGSVPPQRAGNYRMGSSLLNITADATWPGGAGSFGYDWEGTKAQSVDIVKEGKFIEYLTGREQAASIGHDSTGAMRSSSWLKPPVPWITNLVLQPGSGNLASLLAGIDRGILLDTYSRFAPGPNLQGFVARAEVGWLIKQGQIQGMVRNPVYKGYPTAFWSGCDAIAGQEDRQVLGLMDAGVAVGHIVVPLRIRGVKVGASL